MGVREADYGRLSAVRAAALPVTGTWARVLKPGAPTVRGMRTTEPVSTPPTAHVECGSGQAPTPEPPTPAELRRAMGAFASGVTVVTGHDGEEAVGFACQSFASVSLEPPLILFCADHRGRAWPRIRTSGMFCVNVLAEDQTDVCGRFGSARGRKYDGLEWDRSHWGTPALRDVLLRVHCEVYDVHVAGDHDVVIGRVLHVESGPEDRPMVFFRGRFGVDPEPEFAPPDWGWGDRWG
jgi:3-hydroxy-9,10-secoandrosta-1,3,5(10)-triene-9,17-dione monooxygenase reductase component